MRTDRPRLPPLTDEQLDPGQEALIAPFRDVGADFAITRSFVRHPRALKAFNALAMHIFSASDNLIAPREKEILILRTAWRSRSGYEWARHVPLGRRAGLTDADFAALKLPPDSAGWNARDAALIATADALLTDFHMPDDVWDRLSAHYDDRQCIDAILTVGLYMMTAMFLNVSGVAVDPDVTLDPDLDFRCGEIAT